jgi:hypothetical protein
MADIKQKYWSKFFFKSVIFRSNIFQKPLVSIVNEAPDLCPVQVLNQHRKVRVHFVKQLEKPVGAHLYY